LRFENDTETKNREASDELRAVVNKWVMPLYERLEATRLAL
jgi:hypothetical protein